MTKNVAAVLLGLGMILSVFAFATPARAAVSWTNEVSLVPATSNTYTLGTTSKPWLSQFVSTVCLAGDCRSAWPGGSSSGFSTTSADYYVHSSTTIPKTYSNNTFTGSNTFNNTITGSITGNAGTATQLQTARTINGVSFNGTSNITVSAASSSLLSDTNAFTGKNTFAEATSTRFNASFASFLNATGTAATTTNIYSLFGNITFASTTVLTASNAYITKLGNLTNNGFVKTSGSDGTLSIDTSTYLTGNQTITLSGDVSGSGQTSISTTIGSNKVTVGMLAQAAANTVLGNPTGAAGNIQAVATSSLFNNASAGATGLLTNTDWISLNARLSTTTVQTVAGFGLLHSTTSVAYQLSQSVLLGNATSTTLSTGTASTSNLWISQIRNGLLATNGVGGVVGTSTPTALSYISTSNTASIFPFASTTAISANSICLAGDCRSSWPSAGGGAWPFTPATNYGVAVQSTSTPTFFTNGMHASSTSYFTQASSTFITVFDSIYIGGSRISNVLGDGLALSGTTLFSNRVATTSIDTLAEMETIWGSINVIQSTEIDTCGEFIAIMTNVSGTCGSVALTAGPTFTGTLTFANITGSQATSTALFATTASSTNNSSLNATSTKFANIFGQITFGTSTAWFSGVASSTSVFASTATFGTINSFTLGGTIFANGKGTSGTFGIGSTTPSALFGNSVGTTTVLQNALFSTAFASSTANLPTVLVTWGVSTSTGPAGNTFFYLLQQNTSFILNSTSSVPGMAPFSYFTLLLCQDGTGGRTVSFANPGSIGWAFPDGSATPTIKTTANTAFRVLFEYQARTGRYFGIATSSVTDPRYCLP